MQLKHVLSVAAVALVCFGAHAQSQAPGLWEHTVNMKSQDGQMERAMAEMQKQMAAMPPEQRKQVEAAMASRGVKMGENGTTAKVCISKEQAARAAEPHMNGNCTNSDVQRSGKTVKFKFECTAPRASSGEGEWTFVSDKSYTGKVTTTSTIAGKPQQMTIDMGGKWLSADCGDVKPRAMPAK